MNDFDEYDYTGPKSKFFRKNDLDLGTALLMLVLIFMWLLIGATVLGFVGAALFAAGQFWLPLPFIIIFGIITPIVLMLYTKLGEWVADKLGF